MRPFVLPLLVLLCMPAIARAAAPDDVAATFLEILMRDDLTVTAQRVISSEQSPALLFDLRDLTDRHDCFAIARQEWSVVSETADAVTLRMEIHATGTLKGASRRAVPLFTLWHIEAKRDGERWKIVRAQTEERRIAEAMIAAPSAAAAGVILDGATHVDRIETIELYADTLRFAGNIERLDHALSLTLATGDCYLETFVRRAQMIALNNLPDRAPVRLVIAELEQMTGSERPEVRLDAWFGIGLGRYFLGDIAGALEAYAAATALVDEVDDPVRAIKAQHMQSWLLSSTGRLTAALQSATRFALLADKYRWEEGEVVSLFNQAGLHDELHAFEYARDVYLRVVPLARQRGQRHHEVLALYDAARDEMLLANYENAAKLIRETLHDVDSNQRVLMYSLAADIAMHRGRFAEAEEMLRAAEDTVNPHSGQKEDNSGLHAHWSKLHLLAGRTKEALDRAFLALPNEKDWTSSTDTTLVRVEVLLTLARALRASGRSGEAIGYLQQAVDVVDESGQRILAGHERSQIAVIDEVRGAYVELVELLVDAGQAEDALRVAERMRARGLRELIAHGRIDLSASMSAEERKREETLEQRVVDLNRTLAQRMTSGPPDDELKAGIFSARRELDAFRSEMRIAHPAVARRRVTSDPSLELPPSWKDITVVEYVVTEKQTFAFVVARNRSVRVLRLPVSRKELVRDTRRFSREVASSSLTYRAPAKKLHQLLIAPLGPIAAGETLCIIPDVELWSVPFHALIDADGTHLIDRHAVFYAHSLSLARDAAASGTKRGSLLALGNPTIGDTARGSVASAYRDVTLGTLIDAESEVRSLADMYRSDRSRVYYRDAARETTFKREAPEFRVLHIAAHAIVDDAAPMYSSVVLAAGRNEAAEDGLLEAREVVDLPLSADLAVLSACETARGKVGAGEGVVGLAWAFFAAGCSTTVVSQWKAESRATSKLMVEFHRRLLAGDSPAAALRTAQLSLRRNPRYRHPFFWAPFVAIGAASRPTTK